MKKRIGCSHDPRDWVRYLMDELSQISRSEPNRRGNAHSRGGRTTAEELSIECYTKTAWMGYENIMDAGGTFRVYCWGNMRRCGDYISRSIKMSGVSNK